jgi:hypothetical protein
LTFPYSKFKLFRNAQKYEESMSSLSETIRPTLHSDRPQPLDNPLESPKGKGDGQAARLISVAIRILEGLGLILANIFTLGIINFMPDIHNEYTRVFGGKKVFILHEPLQVHSIPTDRTILEATDDPTITAVVEILDTVLHEIPGVRVSVKDYIPTIQDVEEKTDDRQDVEEKTDDRQDVEEKTDDRPSCQELFTKGISLVWDKTKSGSAIAYQAMNKDNAQAVLDVTKYRVETLAGIGLIKAKEQYELATHPENVRKTAITASSIAACVIGAVTYSYLG